MWNLLQLAKCAGAVVIAVARGPAKAEALRRLGADFMVDTSNPKQKLPAAVKAHAPKGTKRKTTKIALARI